MNYDWNSHLNNKWLAQKKVCNGCTYAHCSCFKLLGYTIIAEIVSEKNFFHPLGSSFAARSSLTHWRMKTALLQFHLCKWTPCNKFGIIENDNSMVLTSLILKHYNRSLTPGFRSALIPSEWTADTVTWVISLYHYDLEKLYTFHKVIIFDFMLA